MERFEADPEETRTMARATGAPVPVMTNGDAAAAATEAGTATSGKGARKDASGAGASGTGRAGAAKGAASSGGTPATAAGTRSGPWGASFDGTDPAGKPVKGLSWERRHTRPDIHPYDEIEWELRTAAISSETGKTVFEQKDVEVPKAWSQLATNVVVSKYFRGHVGTPERERSVKQLIDRVVNSIAAWAETQHYFATDGDLRAFQDELTYLLVHQKMAFNSPVWFNVGIEPRPQCSACFINSVQDNMGSIMDLAKTEAMLFKFGSGAGSNLSPIRSSRERMSGGGVASGPVSFMKGYDAFAGVIKSGGKTRRAAKMVILDADHPDVLDFIDSKMLEEKKAWALIEEGYNPSFTGEAYGSVFFQNANHSVRVTDDFMRAVEADGPWTTHAVVTGEPVDTLKAREIFRRMADAAWICGDPGIQYDTTINDWHTSANTDRIYASNPCSEYMFLNDTACFAPETRISTPDGLRAVGDLYRAQERGEKVLVTTDLHGENDHRRMTAHRPALVTLVGDRQVYRMTLKDGRSIRTTGDHKFLTDDGTWKRVDELAPGTDRVEIRESGNPIRFDSSPEDVKRWQMLGWMTGDGVFSKDTAALVFGPDEAATAASLAPEFNRLLTEARAQEEAVERFERALQPGTTLTNEGTFAPAGSRGRTSVSTQTNGVMQVASKSGVLVRMLEDRYGMHQGTAIHKDVPTEIHRVADDLKVAYLQGLFSADGTIMSAAAATEPQVMLASSAPDLVRSVQLMLSDLGITSRTTWVHPKGRANPQAQLHIYNQATRTFMSLVGFPLSEKKQANVQAALARSFDGARKNPRATTVVSIVADGIETVYDVTEPVTHSLIAEGLIAHNCNLASLNLMTFVREDGEFDVEDYRYAARLTITAQEILVDNASYPTPRIEENSHKFRPLGLGYANLGALLMSRGLAYDSDEGRNFAAALTAIMHGEAYRQSSVVARDHGGPFVEYAKNKNPFIRVIRKHRDASYQLPSTGVPRDLQDAARAVFDEALALGEQHGYRNAQVTVLAPTGTIAFMMDCDTTGIEPDIALIKYKKLVGEGFIKIVNQTVPAALRKLGYGPDEVEGILAYVNERETIEGAPGLKPEHLPVFDCAFKPVNGERSIHYMGHVRMMGAVQPFLSGAISKTVNMPEAATADEIEQVYLEGWKRGLKAIAIYRDGSKRSQPLSTGKKKDVEAVDSEVVAELKRQLWIAQAEAGKPHRRRLPTERQAVTHKFEINGHEGYITVGLYPDGMPGEIFLKMAKEGSTVSGLMDTFATTVSVALQYGVPLKDLVNKFAHVRFEPSGFTGNAEIPIAKSIVDYIFRWLGSRFLSDDDKANLGLIARESMVDAADVSTPSGAGGPPYARTADGSAGRPPAVADPPAPPAITTQTDQPKASAVGVTDATASSPEKGQELAVLATNGALAGNGHAANGNGNGKALNGGGITLNLGGVKVAFAAQADAPSCADCGSIMVRNGSCYKCLNCGSTSGCS
jgi:ribonucleoside-diphosphate reductase alpha chain